MLTETHQCISHSTPKLKMLEAAGGAGGGRKHYWEIDHIARLRDIACRSKYVGSMRRARFAVVGGSLSKAGRLGRTRIGLECQVLT